MSDKTEEPTPKRIRRAKEDGDSGTSGTLSQAASFLLVVLLTPLFITFVMQRSSAHLTSLLRSLALGRRGALAVDTWALAWEVILPVGPLLLVGGVASAIVSVVQTGGVVATKRLSLKFDRLNPISGLKGLLSPARAFSVVRALLSSCAVAYFAYAAFRDHLADFAHIEGATRKIPTLVADLAKRLGRDTALFGLALGAVDLLITRLSWLKRLRMSKDEVRREHKESEGDPHLKAARERAHHEMMSSVQVANVKNASVIVVNPTHLACALRYEDNENEAPVVLAQGEGDLARRIVDAAEAYGVPVVRDVPLARALHELSVGDAIPEALYEAVAEILRSVWEAEGGEVDV